MVIKLCKRKITIYEGPEKLPGLTDEGGTIYKWNPRLYTISAEDPVMLSTEKAEGLTPEEERKSLTPNQDRIMLNMTEMVEYNNKQIKMAKKLKGLGTHWLKQKLLVDENT